MPPATGGGQQVLALDGKVPGRDGTWKTTYNVWDGSYSAFVEPEYDSVGAFLYGVYRHYALTSR